MKNNYKQIFITFCFYSGLFAIINTYEDSYTRINNIDTPFESITMPEVDVDALIREDEGNIGSGIPKRFAYSFDVNYGIENSGTWEEIENGGMLWRLGLHSPGAYGMKVLFDAYLLPEGAELYVFGKDEDMSIGPYTYKQNHEDGTFGIPLVKSDHIVVEYYQPAKVKSTPQLNINKVFHAYLDIHNYYGERDDRDCGDNVACSSAADWQDQANSSILLEIGQYVCSSALINNTSQDLTPYVLTSFICVDGEATVGQHNYITFYFNHESSTCVGSSGYLDHSETGSYLRAVQNENSSIVALLEMDDDPPPSWDPYFAGWSRDTSPPTIGAGIHHPNGGPKKINFDDDLAYSCDNATNWCLSWDDGGTAGGSAGSPLFNLDKHIVGQLYSGTEECGGTDYYGKFSTSWDGSNSSQRLKDWLDPGSTGETTLDGTEIIINGCTDSNSCNYDPEATDDDGSCMTINDYTQIDTIPENINNLNNESQCFFNDDLDVLESVFILNDLNEYESSLHMGIQTWTAGRLVSWLATYVPSGNNGLTQQLDQLPDNFGNLTELAGLWIEKHNLTNLPASFSNLTNLFTLKISNNWLISLPVYFGSLTSLTILDLGYNKLESIPESIGGLENLEYLLLFNNQLTSLPETICDLSLDWDGISPYYPYYPYFASGGNYLCDSEVIPDCVENSANFEISMEQNYYAFLIEAPQICCSAAPGDLNGDGLWNVQDIVILANCVLAPNCDTNCLDEETGEGNECYGCAGLISADIGWNILDIVILANCILADDCR